MLKYSLILPCYNVSKYILNCLESIVRNDMSSCEILLVDDGSTDDTIEKCRNFISQYSSGGGITLQVSRLFLKKMLVYHLQGILEYDMPKENT